MKVGIIDTGVDGTHPDIAPNFDAALSRNFTVDIPTDANGDPSTGRARRSPTSPAPTPPTSTRTATAPTSPRRSPRRSTASASPASRRKATIVNLRAGQDSGYFFLQPSVDALTYAGDIGVDVVNMSYYVDPWLFNCADHPADTPAEQAEQQAIVDRDAAGAELRPRPRRDAGVGGRQRRHRLHEGHLDASSPDFASEPGEAPNTRDLLDPASCISMPSEGQPRDLGEQHRAVDAQGVLLGLRQRLHRRRRPGRRRLRHADRRPRPRPRPVLAAYPEALADRQRRDRRRTATRPCPTW